MMWCCVSVLLNSILWSKKLSTYYKINILRFITSYKDIIEILNGTLYFLRVYIEQ
jgi:hypothetical protein